MDDYYIAWFEIQQYNASWCTNNFDNELELHYRSLAFVDKSTLTFNFEYIKFATRNRQTSE